MYRPNCPGILNSGVSASWLLELQVGLLFWLTLFKTQYLQFQVEILWIWQRGIHHEKRLFHYYMEINIGAAGFPGRETLIWVLIREKKFKLLLGITSGQMCRFSQKNKLLHSLTAHYSERILESLLSVCRQFIELPWFPLSLYSTWNRVSFVIYSCSELIFLLPPRI